MTHTWEKKSIRAVTFICRHILPVMLALAPAGALGKSSDSSAQYTGHLRASDKGCFLSVKEGSHDGYRVYPDKESCAQLTSFKDMYISVRGKKSPCGKEIPDPKNSLCLSVKDAEVAVYDPLNGT